MEKKWFFVKILKSSVPIDRLNSYVKYCTEKRIKTVIKKEKDGPRVISTEIAELTPSGKQKKRDDLLD